MSSYSAPGASILVAAPGSGDSTSGNANQLPSIVTTDLLGKAGFNITSAGGYTDTLDRGSSGFNGTSAATPIAAGVVALMLQANPRLGYRDVQEILAYSAGTPTAAPGGATVAQWQTNGATDWNGGGHWFNDDLGFGEIDARAAVRLAETWTKQSTYDNRATATAGFTPAGAISVVAGISTTVSASVASAVRVQHATVSVDMNTADLGAVTLTLVAPNGQTRSVLMDRPQPTSATSLPTKLGYTFDATHDWGESGAGTWQLLIGNASLSQSLAIAAPLSLVGDAAPAGRTFVYTDDYGALAHTDASQAILGALTVGPHTIDAAAVTGDTLIRVPSGCATIAGKYTALGSSLQFGTLITGDGDDTLEGGTNSTVFEPGRGTNYVIGHGAADTLLLLKGLADYAQFGRGDRIAINNSTIGSQDYIKGISRLQFTDGTVVLGSNPLVTDVYYAQQNADVFKAGIAADAHYAAFGWREGRNPDAYFNTSAHLANHADIEAMHVNPWHSTTPRAGSSATTRRRTSAPRSTSS